MTSFHNHLSCLLVLLLLLFLVSSCTSQLPSPNSTMLCQSQQSHALLEFISTFTIDIVASWYCVDRIPGDRSYPKTKTWKEGTDCCSSWDGVKCDEVTGHVIELDLSCSQLRGVIHSNSTLFSSHIAPYLQRLNLGFNDFYGSDMSSEFGVKFGSSLTHLNLSSSYFSGSIPSEIFRLSNLVSLDLSYSLLFNENISSEIALLSNLVSLDLSNSGLSVESDRVLEGIVHNMTRLRDLNLDYVDMSSLRVVNPLQNLSSSLTSLSLRRCQLQHQFPASFLLRPNLQKLYLTSNNFDLVTSFPHFESSSNLRLLDLSGTSFSASASIGLLDFVGNLASLTSLRLSGCNLNGPIPSYICNMAQLRELGLRNNQFTGSLPSCLFALSSLEVLSLDHNNLQGQIPNSLFKSANLLLLDLSFNNFTGFLDFDMFLDLKKLQALGLSNNSLSFSTTSSSYNLSYALPNLSSLYLSSCNLTQFPFFLRALNNLSHLDISDNKIQGPIPEWMFDVGRHTLSSVDLSRNLLTSVGDRLQWTNIDLFDIHSNLLQGHLPIPPTGTRFFSVSENDLSGEISSLICNLTSLQFLDLSHNHFGGPIPQCLGNLSDEVFSLDFGANNFHGAIPDTFAKRCNLDYLNLNENQLKGRLPHSLTRCQNLTVLDVGNNLIEDKFPHWLETLSGLQVLVLRANKFFGVVDGFKSQVFFSELRILDVSDNNFVGQLPAILISNLEAMKIARGRTGKDGGFTYMEPSILFFGDHYYSMTITVKGVDMEYKKILTILTIIDFSRNKFEGDIPRVIGELASLKGLNLSHNLLTGHIPSSMRALVDLEWLDLSSNNLAGKIPIELADLTFLVVLNLSHNRFDGPIPQGRQFNTFGNESYKENLGLCGFPLSKLCMTNEETPSTKEVESLDSAIEFKWEGAYVGYGCGIVFGMFIGSYLVFPCGSPKWFVRMVQGMLGRVVKKSKKKVAPFE